MDGKQAFELDCVDTASKLGNMAMVGIDA